jgi:lycopene beta-cyclase
MSSISCEQTNGDLIIIGAGAAGLTLMLALDELDYPHKVTVLERNKGPLNDRIWSFWDSSSGPTYIPEYIKSIVAHNWSSWTLSTPQQSYLMSNSSFAYCSLRSEDLSSLAQKRANAKPNFNIIYNCNVASIIGKGDMCRVDAEQKQFIANKIIDTRPPPIQENHAGLLQCFYGEEVFVDADIFEPSAVKLMHQIKCSELGIEFVYILPFSKNRALVEFTCFSPKIVDKLILKTRLKEALEHIIKHHQYVIERSETAILPMYPINQNNQLSKHSSINHQNIAYAGIAGGALRASTGYSFLSSQRWATQCALSLHKHNALAKHAPINFIYTAMDKILLRVLLNDISMGVIVFEQMFKKVKPDRFVRFMSQQASFIDIIAVIMAMPKIPFCKVVVQSLVKSPFAKSRPNKTSTGQSGE